MAKIKARQLVQKYRKFFEELRHKWIPSASLMPENDHSALFISAGMHPLVSYLMGEVHPLGKRLVNFQECLRTGDIDLVGETAFHHTWFEMLGNWSLGDYFKKEAISWSFEFLTGELGFDSKTLHVTCFKGDKDIPRDQESALIWEKMGIDKKRIHFLPKKDNFWGPVGKTGPCGPDSEMFFDTGGSECGSKCQPGCSCGKYIEVWNDVFMEYFKNEKGKYEQLKQRNVDTGMGIERTLAALWGVNDNYLTDIWQPIIKKIEEISGKSYRKNKKPIRIIADHLRSAVFVIADGIIPSNKEQGYVLRRLIRRAICQGREIGLKDNFTKKIGFSVFENRANYGGEYPELEKNKSKILEVLENEEARFKDTLDRGLEKFSELSTKRNLTGWDAFDLYQSYGFPLELVIEEAEKSGCKFCPDFKSQFEKAKKSHQKLSQTAAKGKFKGGLLGRSDLEIRYHTATHILQAALRKILGSHVCQLGSNITEKRLRFDFSHPKELSPEEISRAEKLVNQKIKENLAIEVEVLVFEKAIEKGAITLPGLQYPDKVRVYSIADFSKEVCGGPHVKRTGELGKFRIIREESLGVGKRRIYGILNEE